MGAAPAIPLLDVRSPLPGAERTRTARAWNARRSRGMDPRALQTTERGATGRASGADVGGTGDDSDDALIERVARADADACRALVERHLGRMVSFARRTLGDPSEAEDVAQEVFLRLWAHAGRWRAGEARLSTWLHRVAANLCIDRLRKRRERPLEEAPEPADARPHAAEALGEREIGRHVNAAIRELPTSQRMAIAMCHFQGLSNLEAADALGVSVEALESLLARGRRKLRERLRAIAPELLGREG